MEKVFVALAHGIGICDWEDHICEIRGVFHTVEQAVDILVRELLDKGFEPELVAIKPDSFPKIRYTDSEEDMNFTIVIEEHNLHS